MAKVKPSIVTASRRRGLTNPARLREPREPRTVKGSELPLEEYKGRGIDVKAHQESLIISRRAGESDEEDGDD